MNKDKIEVGDLVIDKLNHLYSRIGIGLAVGTVSPIAFVKVYWFKIGRTEEHFVTTLRKLTQEG
jgi:hypothetical protein